MSSSIIKQSFHQKIEAINWRFHALPYKKTPYFSKLQFIVPQGIGLTPASTLTFVLSRKLLGQSPAAPFFMQLSRQLCRRYASAKAQMQVKRMLERRLSARKKKE